MKFDIYNWHEVKTNEEIQVPVGALQLRASGEVAVFAKAHGYEALVGTGTEIRATFAEQVTVTIEAKAGVRAFVYMPYVEAEEPDGEVFTNIDRKPLESGTLLAVKQELRRFQLEQQAILREMKRERETLDRMNPVSTAAPVDDAPPPQGTEGDAPEPAGKA